MYTPARHNQATVETLDHVPLCFVEAKCGQQTCDQMTATPFEWVPSKKMWKLLCIHRSCHKKIIRNKGQWCVTTRRNVCTHTLSYNSHLEAVNCPVVWVKQQLWQAGYLGQGIKWKCKTPKGMWKCNYLWSALERPWKLKFYASQFSGTNTYWLKGRKEGQKRRKGKEGKERKEGRKEGRKERKGKERKGRKKPGNTQWYRGLHLPHNNTTK